MYAVTGMNGDPEQREEQETPGPEEVRAVSSGFLNALTLILVGASIGVFWREVFQLTIRAIETLR